MSFSILKRRISPGCVLLQPPHCPWQSKAWSLASPSLFAFWNPQFRQLLNASIVQTGRQKPQSVFRARHCVPRNPSHNLIASGLYGAPSDKGFVSYKAHDGKEQLISRTVTVLLVPKSGASSACMFTENWGFIHTSHSENLTQRGENQQHLIFWSTRASAFISWYRQTQTTHTLCALILSLLCMLVFSASVLVSFQYVQR